MVRLLCLVVFVTCLSSKTVEKKQQEPKFYFSLLGIISSSIPENSLALIRDDRTSYTYPIKLNQKFGRYKVVGIFPRHVELSNGGNVLIFRAGDHNYISKKVAGLIDETEDNSLSLSKLAANVDEHENELADQDDFLSDIDYSVIDSDPQIVAPVHPPFALTSYRFNNFCWSLWGPPRECQ